MKRRKKIRVSSRLIILSVTALMLALANPFPARAQNVLQLLKDGKIDWSNRVAESYGIGRPPSGPENEAQSRALAERDAVKKARVNLHRVIGYVRIDSGEIVRDLMERKEIVRDRIEAILKNSPVVDMAYRPDGRVKAVLSLSLAGLFSDIVLPEVIRKIDTIKQPEKPQAKSEKPYSGLLVDCRGFPVKSALAPRIISEDGKEVYGSASVSREHALKRGVAGYVRGLDSKQVPLRVGKNPLIIKGIRTAKTGSFDIVISNSDASKTRAAAENLRLLKECRVMIVLD